MSMEYVGLGSINDRHLSARISWTRDEKTRFFTLLAGHKHDLKFVAREMKKSYLEVQAFSDYLKSLSNQVGTGNRAAIPFALETPDDFDDLPAIGVITQTKFKRPSNERLTRLIARPSAEKIIWKERWHRLHRSICNENGLRRGNTRFYARRLLQLFVAEMVCYICDNTTTNRIGAEQVHSALRGLPIMYNGCNVAPLLPQEIASAEYLAKHSSNKTPLSDTDLKPPQQDLVPQDISSSPPVQPECLLSDSQSGPQSDSEPESELGSDSDSDASTIKHESDIDSDVEMESESETPFAGPSPLEMVMNQEEQIDQLDVNHSRNWCDAVAQQSKLLEPRVVSREELLEVRANGQPGAKYENRICVACGLTNLVHFTGGPKKMGWLCAACYLWVRARKMKLSPEEIIKARENRQAIKPKKSCSICARTGETAYHKGLPPFKTVCRHCASWIMQETDKRIVYVDEIRRHLGGNTKPRRGVRKEYILYPRQRNPWEVTAEARAESFRAFLQKKAAEAAAKKALENEANAPANKGPDRQEPGPSPENPSPQNA